MDRDNSDDYEINQDDKDYVYWFMYWLFMFTIFFPGNYQKIL